MLPAFAVPVVLWSFKTCDTLAVCSADSGLIDLHKRAQTLRGVPLSSPVLDGDKAACARGCVHVSSRCAGWLAGEGGELQGKAPPSSLLKTTIRSQGYKTKRGWGRGVGVIELIDTM